MASITRQPGGRRLIQFAGPDRKRQTLRLGVMPQRMAEAIKVRVEQLVASANSNHAVDDATADWLAGLDDGMLSKLAAVGLIPRRATAGPLQSFLDGYISVRGDTKPGTRLVYGHTARNLIEFFGAGRPLRDISPGDADEWRLWLKTNQNLSENTARRRSGIAKQFFRAAVRKHLLPTNPFADLTAAVQSNWARVYFISREDAQRVLDACPDAQWRLLFALSRFGGLRCPSEHLCLRWCDIDWDRNRMTVQSPKTEHHPGGASRQTPIFPELLPYLREVFEQADEGTEFVITRYRSTNVNLRTQLMKIIRRAGLKPWPKLFHNLRSTRETELAESYPLHVVCAWIGNSQLVAAKHYLQVTDDHFAKAAGSNGSALQNALQHSAAPARTTPRRETDVSTNLATCKEIRDDATGCETPCVVQLGDTGFEPVTSCVSSTRSSQLS